jgi:hypothetical protein
LKYTIEEIYTGLDEMLDIADADKGRGGIASILNHVTCKLTL